MGISRELLGQLSRALDPIRLRVANMISRGVVQLVDDGKKLQRMQLGGLAGETIEGDGGAEHFQQYGFSSIPMGGAECVVVFPNGDRSHPLVIATGDRSSRPTGGKAGEVTMYSHTGAKITLLDNGDVHVQAKAGGKVLIDDGTGATELPTMADFNGIISIMNAAGVGAGTALPAAVTSYRAAHPTWPVGTDVFKGK